MGKRYLTLDASFTSEVMVCGDRCPCPSGCFAEAQIEVRGVVEYDESGQILDCSDIRSVEVLSRTQMSHAYEALCDAAQPVIDGLVRREILEEVRHG